MLLDDELWPELLELLDVTDAAVELDDDVLDAAVELEDETDWLEELLLESISWPVARLSVFFRIPSVPACHTSR